MKRPYRFIYFILIFLFFALPNIALAHGVLGKRLFVEPIATEDANVFSEYDAMVPSYIIGEDERELELGTSLTLQLTENLGLEIEGEWVSIDPDDGPRERGFQNPEAVLKYVAFKSPLHEWIATFALSAEFPNGQEKVGAEDFYAFGTGFFYGKGFGDLPERVKYFRPLMVQGDLVAHHHLIRDPGKTFNTLSYDFTISYSIPYLQQFVKDVGIPWPLSRLFPMVELNFKRILDGPELGHIEAFARPGLMWVGKGIQLGLAAVIPISDATREKVNIGITGIVSLYLDDLFPKQFKEPLL